MSIFPSRILLAIDGSEETKLAIRNAVDLADATGSELHLVYVGQLPNFLMKDFDIMGVDRIGVDRKLYDELERESLEILRRLTWQVKASGAAVAGAHLRMGGVAGELVTLAKDLEADLIVIGSRATVG